MKSGSSKSMTNCMVMHLPMVHLEVIKLVRVSIMRLGGHLQRYLSLVGNVTAGLLVGSRGQR